jgi:hypothetical protein
MSDKSGNPNSCIHKVDRWHEHKKRFVVGFLIVSLSLAGFVANSSISAVKASADASVPSSSVPPPMNIAGNAGEAAQSFASANYPNIFGGMALSSEGTHIDIYLTQLNTQAESAIESSNNIPSSEISFIQTPTTVAQQNALHNMVLTNAQALQSQGIDIVAFDTDIYTGHEVAQVVNLTASQNQTLESEFGPNFTAVNIPPNQAPTLYDRENDTSPWNGGDFISDGSEDCSSGIPAHNSGGGYYLITADHCFPLHDSVDNYSASQGYGTGNYIGAVSNVDTDNNGLDAELINTGSSNFIYTGPSVGATRAVVAGTATSPVGFQVCSDGAFEGEHCTETIQSSNPCVLFPGSTRTVCGLVLANGPSSQDAGNGDSGGPVFRFVGSNLEAVGIIEAGEGTLVACTAWPAPGRDCSNNFYYTNINTILAHWGLTAN